MEMTEIDLPTPKKPSVFHFKLVPQVLFNPARAFTQLKELPNATWQTPMVLLTITAIMRVIAAGVVLSARANTGQVTLPPDFQWYSPEQQARMMEMLAARNGPMFNYVFPAISALFGLWIGWLILGGILHLVQTLLGGRSSTGTTMNIVAWATLPFVIRDLVQFIYLLITRQPIGAEGLSGLLPVAQGTASLLLFNLVKLIDIYLIWKIILMCIGINQEEGIKVGKGIVSVLISVIIMMFLQALPGLISGALGDLTIIRPFF